MMACHKQPCTCHSSWTGFSVAEPVLAISAADICLVYL